MTDDAKRSYGYSYHEGPERRQPFRLTDHDIEAIASVVAEKVSAHQACNVFTQEEIGTIRDLLRTKKNVMRITVFVFTAFAALALRDIWMWLAKSISVVWNGK